MKESFVGLGLILFGAVGLVVLVMFDNITVNNDSEYYVLKESVEAAMLESIDQPYYRDFNSLKIIEEKFVANCTRRFYKSVQGAGSGYKLEFYDIMEKPPKVTVRATSTTSVYFKSDYDIVNEISAILETEYLT